MHRRPRTEGVVLPEQDDEDGEGEAGTGWSNPAVYLSGGEGLADVSGARLEKANRERKLTEREGFTERARQESERK